MINLSPFCVPKSLEIFLQKWLAVAPWDFDVVSSGDWVVYCRSGRLVCKLIAVNVLVSRDPVELNVDRLSQKTDCSFLDLSHHGGGFQNNKSAVKCHQISIQNVDFIPFCAGD
jgi:hypothetical protein